MPTTDYQTPEIVTRRELAQILAVSEDTVSRWRKEGAIPCLQVHKQTYRYDVEEVIKALKQHDTRKCNDAQDIHQTSAG